MTCPEFLWSEPAVKLTPWTEMMIFSCGVSDDLEKDDNEPHLCSTLMWVASKCSDSSLCLCFCAGSGRSSGISWGDDQSGGSHSVWTSWHEAGLGCKGALLPAGWEPAGTGRCSVKKQQQQQQHINMSWQGSPFGHHTASYRSSPRCILIHLPEGT